MSLPDPGGLGPLGSFFAALGTLIAAFAFFWATRRQIGGDYTKLIEAQRDEAQRELKQTREQLDAAEKRIEQLRDHVREVAHSARAERDQMIEKHRQELDMSLHREADLRQEFEELEAREIRLMRELLKDRHDL